MISTDTTGITANTLTYTRYNFSDKTTRTYIDELMRLGHGRPVRVWKSLVVKNSGGK
jgi:hypothetical protein